MKKYISLMVLCLFIVGCGKSATENLDEQVASSERKQPRISRKEKPEFIENEEGFVVHMKNIKTLLKHLQTSINHENWEEIKEDMKKLKAASPVAFTGANKDELPKEFVKLDARFHLDALDLINACQERNKDKAMNAFFKVVNGCDECHAKFNPKESSTSWFH